MRADGREVSPRRRPGEGLGGRPRLQFVERAEREREQRRASLFLRGAGGALERAYRLGEERDLRTSGEHGGRVIERARALARVDRTHAQPSRQNGEVGARRVVGAADPGERSAKVRHFARRKRAQRVERPGARALAPHRPERRDPERAGKMDDELPGADIEPRRDRRDRRVGHGEKHDVRVAQRRREQPTAAIPRRDHPHACPGQRLEEGLRDWAAAENCGRVDHSRMNSTPEGPGDATIVSPDRTRPARISSASGDTTSRWITCRIGRAPSAS